MSEYNINEYGEVVRKDYTNIVIKPDYFTFHQSGGDRNVKISSDTEWHVLSDYPNWISVCPKQNELVLTATENTESHVRAGSVTITSGNATKEIKFAQYGQDKDTDDDSEESNSEVLKGCWQEIKEILLWVVGGSAILGILAYIFW